MGRVSLSRLVLIDSGAEDNLLDTQLAQQLGCAVEPLENPIPALALNGEVFTTITHKTSPVAMTVSGNHHEKFTFHLLSSPNTPIVLGHPWLKIHNPHIDWCIDFRGLNGITVKNKYPLPLISSNLGSLEGAKLFSKLDLRNAYHLVRIKEGDEWKTAFNTPLGNFEYLVMPFGLTNAPAVFQALINDVLWDFINRFVVVYLDDILIYSGSMEEHISHVCQVLTRLLENRLFVKAEKCDFHVDTVSFLGYIMQSGSIKPDPEKIRAVEEWPVPKSRKELQRFLGFANFYRRFIRDYSKVASPLTRLTSVNVTFCWSPEAHKAFLKLKHLFSSAPILVQPESSKQFIVEVDASDAGVGAVLSQYVGPENRLHPCAFFSRRLSPTECNYDIGNRELLAVKLALEEWRHWLEGAEKPFVVWTDHKNLTYIQTAKRLNSRQARWAFFFSRFNFTLTYRPGSRNIKPDALSRLYSWGLQLYSWLHPSIRTIHCPALVGDREGCEGCASTAARPR